MRALMRYCLAPLLTAAVLSAGAPAHLSAGPLHTSVAASAANLSCPPGTYWDHILQECI